MVEIAEHSRPITMPLVEKRADLRVGTARESLPVALKQQRRLLVVRVHRVHGGLRVNMRVEHEQVLVAVQIKVKKPARPAEEGSADQRQAELLGSIIEERAVEVEVKRVGITGEIGGE